MAGPSAPPVTLVGSGVFRQVTVDYSGGAAVIDRTDGLSCNTEGELTFKDGSGANVTRFMLAGVDYPWSVTEVTSSSPADLGIVALYSR